MMSGARRCIGLGLPMLLFACASEDDFVLFNADNQTIQVEVLPEGEPPGEPASLELLSNLSLTVLGTATVDPASGPVGGLHQVSVIVLDEFEDLVDRATVLTSAEAVSDLDGDDDLDSRGIDEHEMRQDSADPGAWAVTVQSLGEPTEMRTDVFTIRLWQFADDVDAEPTTTPEDAT